ncbi:MAG TPA: enoyl-CoA hydratase-related protein [Novosphingobium sp.]|nr:enoyl-CoA hydratase-related protein [Novosphingobium sp.]
MNDSSADMVLMDIAGGVMRLTLNRADRANAIAPEGRDRIIALLRQADADPEIRAVLIGSTGKHFCSGADVSRMASSMAEKRVVGSTMRTMLWGAQALVTAVLDCGKPVVAAVQGPAAGLGATLALACDLIVASDAAWFSFPFTMRGLSMDAGSAYLLPRRVGLQKAKELAFFGDRLTAADALELGMVNRVCSPDAFDASVEEVVGRLAKGATTAISLSKRLLNASLDSDRQGAFLAEAMSQEINSKTDDVREGITAFAEKRDVAYRGY